MSSIFGSPRSHFNIKLFHLDWIGFSVKTVVWQLNRYWFCCGSSPKWSTFCCTLFTEEAKSYCYLSSALLVKSNTIIRNASILKNKFPCLTLKFKFAMSQLYTLYFTYFWFLGNLNSNIITRQMNMLAVLLDLLKLVFSF